MMYHKTIGQDDNSIYQVKYYQLPPLHTQQPQNSAVDQCRGKIAVILAGAESARFGTQQKQCEVPF